MAGVRAKTRRHIKNQLRLMASLTEEAYGLFYEGRVSRIKLSDSNPVRTQTIRYFQGGNNGSIKIIQQ